MAYYDGTKLLSLKDLDGEDPELYICNTNRSAGKTTFFARYYVNRFLKYGEKFGIQYRYSYELDNVADKFFKDIKELFFPNKNMTEKKRAKGLYVELFIDDVSCGYAFALNNADQIKKYSHLFSDIVRYLFDEFQSETGHYCNDEITKFLSIHKSIARGGGKQYRKVPVHMLSNTVSIINPYFVELGISSQLRQDTKYLRGHGFVLEQSHIDITENADSSGIEKAFAKNKYVAYASQNVYLNDSYSFIANMNGKFRYLCTIKYKDTCYSLKEYADKGIIYCDSTFDNSFPLKISVTTDDHDINFVMLNRNEFFISTLRDLFNKGCFRFKDLRCKEALLKTISY